MEIVAAEMLLVLWWMLSIVIVLSFSMMSDWLLATSVRLSIEQPQGFPFTSTRYIGRGLSRTSAAVLPL